MKGVMGSQYTAEWGRLLRLLTRDTGWSKVQTFTIKYIFQSSLHTIWCERNRRRHGEDSCPVEFLIRRIDKNMRNKFTILRRRGDKVLGDGMVYWFSTREE